MGESSLLLAEASVGKNAERDSHELGAREPSISTAAACVGPHGAARDPDSHAELTAGTVIRFVFFGGSFFFFKKTSPE